VLVESRQMLKRLFLIWPWLWASAWAIEAPNVLLIIADDQSWTDFGFAGHGAIEPPNLDRLAEEGALFTHGYVPTPSVIPVSPPF
jgi:uncharacterized sulfatase